MAEGEIYNIKHIVTYKAHKGYSAPRGQRLSAVNAIAVFPDKEHFISGGYDATIKLWNISDIIPVKIWRQETDEYIGGVTSLVIIDENTFLSGGYDRTIKLWDKTRDEPLKTIIHGCNIDQIALFPDKRYFISLCDSYSNGEIEDLKLWDFESIGEKNYVTRSELGVNFETINQNIGRETKHDYDHIGTYIQRLHSIATLPSSGNSVGRFLLGGIQGRIELWDFKVTYTNPFSGTQTYEFSVIANNKDFSRECKVDDFVTSLVIIPDSESIKFLSGYKDNKYTVTLWTIDENEFRRWEFTRLKIFRTDNNNNIDYVFGDPVRIAIFPDNKHFISNYGGTIKCWSIDQPSEGRSHIVKRPERVFFIRRNVDGVGEDQTLPKERIKTLVVMDNNNILSGGVNRHVRWYSTYDRPIGKVNTNWFGKILPNENINHISGYANLQTGDKYIDKIEKPKGGMKKSKRVNKRYIKKTNKTHRRK